MPRYYIAVSIVGHARPYAIRRLIYGESTIKYRDAHGIRQSPNVGKGRRLRMETFVTERIQFVQRTLATHERDSRE